MTRLFTASELAIWRRCKRKWRLTYHERWGLDRPDTYTAAGLGTMVHLGLQVHYDPDDSRDPWAVMKEHEATAVAELEAAAAPPWQIERTAKHAQLAATMVDGYVDWIAETGADDDLEVVAVERPVSVPLGEVAEGVALLGKLDMRLRRRSDGARLAMDHKTVQSIDGYTATAHISGQFRHYSLLEHLDHAERKRLGQANELERADGLVINLLRRTARGKTSKPPFFGRWEVRYNLTALRSYWTQVVAQIRDILTASALLEQGTDPHKLTPPNPTRDCAWDCPFLPVCSLHDDGSDVAAALEASYVRTDPLARYGPGTEWME